MTNRAKRLLAVLLFASLSAAGCLTVTAPSEWTWRIRAFREVNFSPFLPDPGRHFYSVLQEVASPGLTGGSRTTWYSGATNNSGTVHCSDCTWGQPSIWMVTWNDDPCYYDLNYLNAWWHDTITMLCHVTTTLFFSERSESNAFGIDDVPEWYGDISEPAAPYDPGTLNDDERLEPDEYIDSESGQYRLLYQQDGNLVVYDLWDSWNAVWSAGITGGNAGRAHMQSDGNLVLYNDTDGAMWDSGTAGNSGAYLILADDGHLLLVSSGGVPLWWSNN